MLVRVLVGGLSRSIIHLATLISLDSREVTPSRNQHSTLRVQNMLLALSQAVTLIHLDYDSWIASNSEDLISARARS
jgi:hypothetical protein